MSNSFYLFFRSVEEHLEKCGSEQRVGQGSNVETTSKKDESISSQPEYEDVSDDSLEDFEPVETTNPFSLLPSDSSGDHLATMQDEDTGVSMETDTGEKPRVKFYRNESEFEDAGSVSGKYEGNIKENLTNENCVAMETGVAIDTVRRFSGLDKAAVIGINPYVNEEHADFKKFLLSLATRAKDNLVIITTSDNIKKQLDKLV